MKKWIVKSYKTAALANYGLFITISIGVLLLVGVAIPKKHHLQPKEQWHTLKGLHIKHNDEPHVAAFLRSIKKNDGYLVLGTSESGSLRGGNYYDYLNGDRDSDLPYFSPLAGAGRTCGVQIPMLLHHQELVDSLKLIYLINPVYWRENLSRFELGYYRRYNNFAMCKNAAVPKSLSAHLTTSFEAYSNRLNFLEKGIEYAIQLLRSLRRNYFFHFRNLLGCEDSMSDVITVKERITLNKKRKNFGKPPSEKLDSALNIPQSFTHKQWYKPIGGDKTFRFKELEEFVILCQHLGIETTFVVGPYNRKFVKKYDPSNVKHHNAVVKEIKNLLKEHQVDWLDASDLSDTLGAFTDHQHHSNYGAYLLYKRIKKHLNEK